MSWQSLNDFYRETLEKEKKGKISGFYAVIPHYVLEDNSLTSAEKIIYGEISSLVNKFGYCYATNKHLINFLKISQMTICRSLKKLSKRNYIRVEIEKNKLGTFRKIWITCGKPVDNLWKNRGGAKHFDQTGANQSDYPKEITQIDNNNKEKNETFKKEGGEKPV